jgi:FlaA1/EpsC-like NDP-sugar epimerase
LDIVLVNLAALGAVVLRFNPRGLAFYWDFFKAVVPVLTGTFLAFLFVFGLYRRVWRYANLGELVVIAKAVVWSCGSLFLLDRLLGLSFFPFYVYLLFVLFSFTLTSVVRFIDRLTSYFFRTTNNGRKTLIVGAGGAGVLVARTLRENSYHLRAVAFVDDDPKKIGLKLLGLPVLGTRYDIPLLVKRLGLEEIIIALPSVDKEETRKIVAICGETGARIKILPSVFNLIDGKLPLTQIRDVELEDLLHREPTKIDVSSIAGYLTDQVVLVSGGAGSIGSELCRQIAPFNPRILLVFDHNENGLFELSRELNLNFPSLNLVTELGDIRDRGKVFNVFYKYKPQVVFHAAAHKHVPILELCPEEAVKNNVWGSFNLTRAAESVGCETFIFISSDKAVEPVSIMGMSKRVGEMIIREMNRLNSTKFASVRFGNVLGSRGSVIPLFRKQIEAGGPLTITHPGMSRYFMTLEEAVRLTIQAGALTRGGETFILNMGEQIKIVDLALDLIRLSGLRPEIDVKLQYVGVRPGEKLEEQLWEKNEIVRESDHPRIMLLLQNFSQSRVRLFKVLEELTVDLDCLDSQKARDFLIRLVKEDVLNREKGEVCGEKASNYGKSD